MWNVKWNLRTYLFLATVLVAVASIISDDWSLAGLQFALLAPGLVSFRPEQIGDIALSSTNREYNLNTQGGQLPSDRFIERLRLTWRGRFTNPATGNPTGRLADAPYSIIERITVEGYHRVRRKSERFIDLRAADLRELVRCYDGLAPYTSHNSADLSVAASATNDVEFVIDVPFTPLNLPLHARMNWLLDAPNYDALKLSIFHADALSVFSGQTNAVTLSAYGSATGDPQIRCEAAFAQAGAAKFRGFIPGRVWRYFQEVTGSNLTTTATDTRLLNLPKGHFLRALLVKTGVKGTGVTAGNNGYATLSDAILTRLELFRGQNRLIREYRSFVQAQADIGSHYRIRPSAGYALLDWALNGWDGEVLDTRGLVAGPTGDVDLYFEADVAGAANQAMVGIYEEWRDGPLFARRVG